MMQEYKNKQKTELEIIFIPEKEDIIIDIREESEIKKKPLKIINNELLIIPFFEINHKYKNLDQTKKYLFYCEKGILSNLH
jgi:tRNA uracil 4-sulfurtransferase